MVQNPVRPRQPSPWLATNWMPRRSLLLEVVTRMIFHIIVVLSVYVLFVGHDEPGGGFAAGVQTVPLSGMSRQRTYELELASFLPAIKGERPPDRSLDHEVLVQETLLRLTGRLAGAG